MAQTEHFVQTFKKQGRRLVGSPPAKCRTAELAAVRGAKAAEHADGVVVFSVSGEPEFGEFDQPVVHARHGDVPAEFSA